MKNKLILPLLILPGLVLGCSSIQKLAADKADGNGSSNASNTGTGASRAPENAPPAFSPSGDAKSDIEKMADRFLSIESFRAKMTSEGTMTMNADLDYIAPDKFKMKTELPNGQSSEMILIGKHTYMKIGERWQKMPADIGTKVPNMRETFTQEGMKWFKQIKYEGEESAEGKAAYLYSYDGEAPGGGNAYSSKIWVAKSDGRPIKIHAVYKSGDMKAMNIVYDYETKVTIEPPIGD